MRPKKVTGNSLIQARRRRGHSIIGIFLFGQKSCLGLIHKLLETQTFQLQYHYIAQYFNKSLRKGLILWKVSLDEKGRCKEVVVAQSSFYNTAKKIGKNLSKTTSHQVTTLNSLPIETSIDLVLASRQKSLPIIIIESFVGE